MGSSSSIPVCSSLRAGLFSSQVRSVTCFITAKLLQKVGHCFSGLTCRAAAALEILGYIGLYSGLYKSDVPRASSGHKLLHFSHLIQLKPGFCKTIMIPAEINTQILHWLNSIKALRRPFCNLAIKVHLNTGNGLIAFQTRFSRRGDRIDLSRATAGAASPWCDPCSARSHRQAQPSPRARFPGH